MKTAQTNFEEGTIFDGVKAGKPEVMDSSFAPLVEIS
jgi:hypothetical protein